jgi:hypothetical protein
MTEPLFEALTDWEAGDLSVEELVARHPEVAGILAVHERLSALAAEPGPDPEQSLVAVRERIADRPAISRPKRASKVFVAALAAAALTGSAAIAAPGAVRSVVDGVRSGIERIFGSEHPDAPGTSSAPITRAPDHDSSESPEKDDEGNGPGRSGDRQGDSGQQEGTTQGGEDEGSQGDEGSGGDEQQGGGDEQQGGGDEQQGGGDEQQGGGDEQQGSGDDGGSGGDSGQDQSASDGNGGSADQPGGGD